MWFLYCLPGRIITQFAFLFPGHARGDITATRRRNESGCAHFFFATVVWAVVAIFSVDHWAPQLLNDGSPGRRDQAAQSVKPAVVEPAPAASTVVEDEQPVTPPEIAPNQAARGREPKIHPSPRIADSTINPSQPAVRKAMEQTFRDGSAHRWHTDDNQSGYAVASEPNSVGCRTIEIAPDKGDAVRANMCPEDLGADQ